ncbi:MAG: ThiF family adenylyltransferase, partial [Thermoleophilia bacterium]
MRYSAALTSSLDDQARTHLLRPDGQEDLCFGVYHESRGLERTSALVRELILPSTGERHVHGNASFTEEYFLRALARAIDLEGGLALLHSHPLGEGWQGMSSDDIYAERSHCQQALAVTGLPLVGLTLAGDGSWSCRIWPRRGRHDYAHADGETVRVIGDRFDISFNPALRPKVHLDEALTRTVSAWGEDVQQKITRLQIGVVGAGSVGSIVAEALARTGVQHVVVIDYDGVERRNLDRLVQATRLDVLLARSKGEVLARALRRSATVPGFKLDVHELSVVEEEGFRRALDCDLLFCCVDAHW